MKKQPHGILFAWILIVALVAGGIFLVFAHFGAHGEMGMIAAPAMESNMDVEQNDSTASDTAPAAVAMQTFSDNGYAFSIPASWNIERTGSDTIAVHSDSASPDAACKIEVSAFPFPPNTDISDWIAHRIGADPSLAVTEESSENVSFASGTGVKWMGTIDEIPTTLVYAFNDGHAYEIAPSVVHSGANDSASCDDMLGTFLSALTI